MRTPVLAAALLVPALALAQAPPPGDPAPAATDPAPDDERALEDAREKIEAIVKGVARSRRALEFFGFIPQFECGEPRRSAIEKIAAKLKAQYSCARVTTEAVSETEDHVVFAIREEGCLLGKKTKMTGRAVVRVSGGNERLGVLADLHGLALDGAPLETSVGYETCGDEKRVRLESASELPKGSGQRWELALLVGVRPGMPIIGSTTLVLNGTVGRTRTDERDEALLSDVVYEPGEFLPKTGTIEVATRSGRKVRTTFQKKFWRLGRAEIAVDGRKPVVVPIVR